MRIFITGITGLLGTNLVTLLLNQGYHVTAIVRDPKKYVGYKTNNLRLIKMELWDDYDLYLKEIDIVVHLAAETATNLLKYSDYARVNYDATIRLFEKSIKAKVQRFIFVSTANTIGYGSLKQPGTEAQKVKQPFNKLYYAQTKLQAEQYLISKKNDIPIIILNPTFMIGPSGNRPSSGKIILMGMNKRIVFYPPGGKNFVPVTNVAEAIINSFRYGKSGERYLIAAENISYRDFFLRLKYITRQQTLLVPIPKFVLLGLGLLGNCLRVLHIRTSLSFTNMKALCIKNYYSNSKSLIELNVSYSSLDAAIIKAVLYFQSKN